MKTKKNYMQPMVKVVTVETQIIAQSPQDWNAPSVHLLMDFDKPEDEGIAD